jgi:two-component system osmolarity sensor histidine kinase EnvZ
MPPLIKRFLPNSLFGRSLVILLMPLLMVQVVLGYIFFDRHTETILRQMSNTIAGDITMAVDLCEHSKDNFHDIKKKCFDNLSLVLDVSPQLKLDKTGKYKNSWLYSFLALALNKKLSKPYFLRMNSDYIFVQVESKIGVLNIVTSRKRLFSRTTPLVLIWTTTSALLLFIVASLFMRNQIKPLRKLAEAAEKFGKGDDKGNFKLEGATEIRKAGQAFNIMRNRITKQLQERLEMLAKVSHDLRTPLTRMKLQLILLESTEINEDLKEDVNLMQNMIEGFLLYARGVAPEATIVTNIHNLLKTVISKLPYPTKKISLICDKNININLRPSAINRCLTNLLLNSCKYADKIQVTCLKNHHNCIITIEDDGPGIDENEREKVFQPFYRTDNARNLDKGGSGLGLTIVKDIVNSHGGKVSLQKSDLGGLKVEILLPR